MLAVPVEISRREVRRPVPVVTANDRALGRLAGTTRLMRFGESPVNQMRGI
jgi:hypothetical protein